MPCVRPAGSVRAFSDMLDFTLLQTPPDHGGLLIAPAPAIMARWTRENHRALAASTKMILGRPLSFWRSETRTALSGHDDRMVIVLGHQPEFIHPGVWAKHVVADRLARALGGVAINLIVDHDAAKSTLLSIPQMSGGELRLRTISTFDASAGYAFEQLSPMSTADVKRFADEVRSAMNERFDASFMPDYLRGLSTARLPDDRCGGGWVAQHVEGRRTIERALGLELTEYQVSRLSPSPMLIDLLLNAERFCISYNEALASYRRAQGLRGKDRPIPDLARREQAIETPVWVYRSCEARRRLFVERAGRTLRLFADRDEMGSMSVDDLVDGAPLRERFEVVGGWRFRPRALTLTLWARLLLADLFIHGIGGAKYDRITDAIIADYYGLEPPKFACVSATLRLDLPRTGIDEAVVRRLEHDLRDVRFNPQRHVDLDHGMADLLEQRAEAVRQDRALRDDDPQNHRARRAVFRRIRALNAAMLAKRPGIVEALSRRVAESRASAEADRIARGREYFFGLYDADALRHLMEALPPVGAFAV